MYVPAVGSFEVGAPIVGSYPLVFNGSPDGFTAYNGGLASKESPYSYDKLSVENLKFCAHMHTTHAETGAHVKNPGSAGLEYYSKYLLPQLCLVLEVQPTDTLEVSVDIVKQAYESALGTIYDSKLRSSTRLFKVALIKFSTRGDQD